MISSDGYFMANSICLPKRYVINTEYEYAIQSGWGYIDLINNKAVENIDNLRSTIMKILPFEKFRDYHKEFLYSQHL